MLLKSLVFSSLIFCLSKNWGLFFVFIFCQFTIFLYD
ncbi:membrane protein [Helicobacter pylori]|uniref:Membrane protein n=1 Tax=Helicobacter pylori UM037 TaxID=1321939 RepID=A0AB33Z7S1_HELPX|nr:hypothetical protein HPSH_00345 [Helicobacter pylori Shi470]ADO04821.1 hypothetical protein HPSAT_00320 [Helicobacter pylori Sat464]AGL70556.1 membrane protein [Helicobacter pylori UM037]AHZ26241.1 membrane protein [Helicobacter pylori]EPZ72897.1 membrane protein [Helicobacter pylori UM111]